jgi:LysM repeat protein
MRHTRSVYAVFIPIFCILSLMSSCVPKQQIQGRPPLQGSGAKAGTAPTKSNPTVRSASGTVNRPGTSSVGLAYIEQFHEIAVQEMQKFGIPASIKLAQALLESGQGTSRLAREANNHFGIKCGGDWTGPRIFHDDDERDDCFRVYQSAEHSFSDHSKFLLRKRYEGLFSLNKMDYKAWAHGLKAAGYATNPRYAELLINLIERYELYRYDQLAMGYRIKDSRATTVDTGSRTIQQTTQQTRSPLRIHEVLPGESIERIAQKYSITVNQIIQWNELKQSAVHPGQLLIVSP